MNNPTCRCRARTNLIAWSLKMNMSSKDDLTELAPHPGVEGWGHGSTLGPLRTPGGHRRGLPRTAQVVRVAHVLKQKDSMLNALPTCWNKKTTGWLRCPHTEHTKRTGCTWCSRAMNTKMTGWTRCPHAEHTQTTGCKRSHVLCCTRCPHAINTKTAGCKRCPRANYKDNRLYELPTCYKHKEDRLYEDELF